MKVVQKMFMIMVLILLAKSGYTASDAEILKSAIDNVQVISLEFKAMPGSNNDDKYFSAFKDAEGYFEFGNNGSLGKFKVGTYVLTWRAMDTAGGEDFFPFTETIKIVAKKVSKFSYPHFMLKNGKSYAFWIPAPNDNDYNNYSVISCDKQTLIQSVGSVWTNTNGDHLDGMVRIGFEADFNQTCVKIVTDNWEDPNYISDPIAIDPTQNHNWDWVPNPDLKWYSTDPSAKYGEAVLEGAPTFSMDKGVPYVSQIVTDFANSTLTQGNGRLIFSVKIIFTNEEMFRAKLDEISLKIHHSENMNIMDVHAYIEGDPDYTTNFFSLENNYVHIDLSELERNEDDRGVVSLMFEAVVLNVGTGDYLQAEIENVNSDITFEANGELYHPALSFKSVRGGQLSN